MTEQELDILTQESARQEIERHLGDDPSQAALRMDSHAALLATQIKYLQRARAKLPSYYDTRCIIPPLAFEQASSEATAAAKPYTGELCIDLTCGLGVDALYLSRRFRRVVALERDPVLARVARYNFERLGAGNIEVVETAAETFVASFTGHADLIYADPARRGDGNRRLLRLEDCSPDIRELMPRLREISGRIVVKASPLFDADEAFALFGPGLTVEAVSLHGECKELLIDMPAFPGAAHGKLRATIAGGSSVEFGRDETRTGSLPERFEPPYRYLLIPDVALYKIRTARRYLHSVGAFAPTETGYGFAQHLPERFLGRAFPIESVVPYRPKTLKPFFKERGTKRLNVLKRDFPFDAETVAKALGIRQGGNGAAAFTTIGGERYAVLLARYE